MAKLSPMFDVEEAFRIFGDTASVEVLSLRGECKEVLVRVSSDPEPESGTIRVSRSEEDSLLFDRGEQQPETAEFTPPYGWFGVPDVSLGKARLVSRYAARIGAFATSTSGYCLSNRNRGTFSDGSFRSVRRYPTIRDRCVGG